MSEHGPIQLEQIIRDVMPERADSVLEKYRKVSLALQEAVSGDLIGDAPAEHYRDARSFIDNLEQSILAADDTNRRSMLVQEFADELQYLESSLGLDSSATSIGDIEIPKESQPGFAQLLETAEAEDLLDELSNEEKGELLKTFIEGLNITEKQRLNILQVQMIGIMLESIKSNIEEDRTIGEKLSSEGKRPEQIAEMVASLDSVTAQIVSRPNAVLNQLISPEIKQLLTYEGVEYHKSHTHTRLVQDGRILEARSMEELQQQYVALLSFLRDNRDYLRAQDLIEKQLLAEHFQEKQKEIPEAQLLLIHDKSRQKIEGMVGKHKLRESWRQAGMGTEGQNLLIDELASMDIEREKNKWIIKYLGEKPFEFKSSIEAEIFDQYSQIVGINGHIADEDWDFVIDQVLINAPLILAGGVVGMAARALINGAVRGVIATGALARAGLAVSQATGRVVATGRLGRALYLGGKGVGLGLEAAAFETAFLGLQGVNIADLGLSEALKKILWTAATLGVFKLVGEQAVQVSNFLTKNLTKFPDVSVRNTIQKLIVTGNFEVAAVFGLGALQYYIEQGSFEDFEFVDQFLHALVAVGALKAAGGMLQFGGKTFFPKGMRPSVERPEAISGLFERTLNLARKSPQKLIEAMSRGGDLPFTLKQFGEIFQIISKNIRNVSPDFVLNILVKLKDIDKLATKANIDAFIARFAQFFPSKEMIANFKNIISKLNPKQLGAFCLLFAPGCQALTINLFGLAQINLLPPIYLLVEALSKLRFGELGLKTAGSVWLRFASGARDYKKDMKLSLEDSHARMVNVEGQDLQHLFKVKPMVTSYLKRIGEIERDLLPHEIEPLRTFRTDVEAAVNDLDAFLHQPTPTRDGVIQRVNVIRDVIRNGTEGLRADWPDWVNKLASYRTLAIIIDIIILLNFVPLTFSKSDEKSEEDEKKADVIGDIDDEEIDEAVDDLLKQGGTLDSDAMPQGTTPINQGALESDMPIQQPTSAPQSTGPKRKLKHRF